MFVYGFLKDYCTCCFARTLFILFIGGFGVMFLFSTKRSCLQEIHHSAYDKGIKWKCVFKKKKKKDFPLNVFRISRTYRFQWPARGHFKKSIWNHSNWTTAILTETMLCMYIIEGFVFCTACGKNTQLDVGLPAASKFWQGRRLWLIISYHWPEILSEQLKRK